jgi:multiple sugar transport system substrate-binding protein
MRLTLFAIPVLLVLSACSGGAGAGAGAESTTAPITVQVGADPEEVAV